MKSFLREIRLITSSMMIGVGVLFVGIVLWYFLFGSCGYINAGMAIRDMNKIFDGWQKLREPILADYKETGKVQFEQIEIMKGWKDFLYNVNPPACLSDAKSYLEQGIDGDYDVLFLNPTDITTERKLEMIKAEENKFIMYKQSVDLISACIPTCNWDKDFLKITQALSTP